MKTLVRSGLAATALAVGGLSSSFMATANAETTGQALDKISTQFYATHEFKSCTDEFDSPKSFNFGRIYSGTALYDHNSKMDTDGSSDGTSLRVLCSDNVSPGLYDITPWGVYIQPEGVKKGDDPRKGLLLAKPEAIPGYLSSMIKVDSSSDTKSTSSSSAAVRYKDCADAEKKHSGPIPKSDPRYRVELDKNHNGIACEANTPVGHSSTAASQPAQVVGPKVVTDVV